MQKARSLAVAQRATHWQEDFVRWWSASMWILAAIYLATSVTIH